MSSIVRVMFIGHGPSGLPEDRVVNTFHFLGAGSSYGVDAAIAIEAVRTFYGGTNPNSPVGAYLSPWVQRDYELRAYDLLTPKPRVPTIATGTLPPVISNAGLPEEVACCLSYAGGALPTTRRKRGRIYLGPLVAAATSVATSTQPCRPTATFILDLLTAAQRLATAAGENVTWVVRTEIGTPGHAVIDRGYVDNALDTQRRRGPKTTARTLFPVPG